MLLQFSSFEVYVPHENHIFLLFYHYTQKNHCHGSFKLSRYIGIRKPEITQNQGFKGNSFRLEETTKQPFCTWVTTTRFQLQWQNFIRSISNESDENNYKHKDLFTKHKLKQQTLRVKDQKCELWKMLHLQKVTTLWKEW